MVSNLIDYYAWANQEWTDYIYDEHIDDEYLLKVINHIAKGTRAWTDQIMTGKHNDDLWEIEKKCDLFYLESTNKSRMESLLADRPNERIVVDRGGDLKHEIKVIDIINHLLTHGDHHRGQLAAHCSIKGYLNKPDINYMNFCLLKKI